MKESDIKGLTPEQIKDKFALPEVPKFKTDVIIKKGSKIRTGTANGIDGMGKGGGTQFDTMGQYIGEFGNEKVLK